MPLRNRVTPFGEIVAAPERGLLFGNRGILHDEDGRLVRNWQVRRWLACRLAFRGRWRPTMQPGRFTGLFFLDEATALARRAPAVRRMPAPGLRAIPRWMDPHAPRHAGARR